MENQGIRDNGNGSGSGSGSGSGKDPIFVPTHLSGLKVRSFNQLKPPVEPSVQASVEPLPMNEDENIPMDISVASVAAAAMDAMPDREEDIPENPGNKPRRTQKPRPKKAAAAADNRKSSKDVIARMKKDLEEGRQRLKPEELNNPFSKEFNKVLLKKELLEREMT